MSLLQTFIIYSLWLNTITNSFNKTCHTYECKEHIMQCPYDEPNCSLFVACLGYKSCEGALVDCTTSGHCNLDCRGQSSCDELHLICPAESECNINCVSEEDATCSGINVTSNTNTVTNIQCKGDDACYAANIDCADSAQCNLQCYGQRACSGERPRAPFNIYGERAHTVNVSQCSGTAPCAYMNVFCPSSEISDTPRCLLPGNGIFNERAVHPPKITGGGINIYAIHSWYDVRITNYDASNLVSGTMFCGPHNNASCGITNENGGWDCVDDTHLCAILVYTEPTSDPTIEPTYTPTGNPTVNPTMDPTESPTKEPTLDPTDDPTTEPTQPSTTPTRAPTTEPTQDPTSAPSYTERQVGGATEYGLLVAVILFVVFICLMICGWRYWNKGNDLEHTDQSLSMLRQRKRKRKRKNNGDEKRMQLNDGSDSMDDSDTGAEVIQVVQVQNKKNNADIDMNGHKKMRKKKKKRKKKDSAGHYQKQSNDPFQNNQWTELTNFD